MPKLVFRGIPSTSVDSEYNCVIMPHDGQETSAGCCIRAGWDAGGGPGYKRCSGWPAWRRAGRRSRSSAVRLKRSRTPWGSTIEGRIRWGRIKRRRKLVSGRPTQSRAWTLGDVQKGPSGFRARFDGRAFTGEAREWIARHSCPITGSATDRHCRSVYPVMVIRGSAAGKTPRTTSHSLFPRVSMLSD